MLSYGTQRERERVALYAERGGGRRRREVKCVLMTNLGCSGAEVATQVNKLK
jgi:hypothetical protein